MAFSILSVEGPDTSDNFLEIIRTTNCLMLTEYLLCVRRCGRALFAFSLNTPNHCKMEVLLFYFMDEKTDSERQVNLPKLITSGAAELAFEFAPVCLEVSSLRSTVWPPQKAVQRSALEPLWVA